MSKRRRVPRLGRAIVGSDIRRLLAGRERGREAHAAPSPGRPHSGTPMLIPLQWIGLFATATVFVVMFALGLMLGREQIAAALQRRVVLAAVIFAVVVPIPALAVLVVKVFALTGPVAAGIVLMAISPGAPVALRRALDAGGDRASRRRCISRSCCSPWSRFRRAC